MFNFLAQKLTTVYKDWIYEPRGSYDSSSMGSISTQAVNEYFCDMPSTAEVRLMHAKLVELKGNPPSLEEVLPGRAVKKRALGS